MPFIPNWIKAANPIEAMEAGGRLGLASRSEADSTAGRDADRAASTQEAAQRLKLSYDSLAQQQQNQQQQMLMQQRQADAANKLRAQQADALSQYRSQQQQFEQAKLKDAEAKQTAAQVLKANADASTQGFFQSIQDGKDPLAAMADNPGVPPAVAHPLIAGHLASQTETQREQARSDAATKLADHQDELATANSMRQRRNKELDETAKVEDEMRKEADKRNAPPAPLTAAQLLSGRLKAISDFGIRGSETEASPAFQTRTNMAGNVLRSLPPLQGSPTAGPAAAPAAPAAPAVPAAAKPVEVVRITKDGKRAIYDATTKQFLRYADQ